MDSMNTLRCVSHKLDLEPDRNTLAISDSGPTDTVPLGSDLVTRAQTGDSDAIAALFLFYKARIYSVCLRMTGNTAEAEDLTQDAFLQMFRKITSFRGDSAFSTWLHRIAVNTVLMHFRKKSLCQVSLDEPYGDDSTKARHEYGTRDRGLAGCVDRITLTRALKELPPGYRTIFLLHEVEGYEHQEIAEMLGCSVGNSKSQLYKAKLRIREFIAHSPAARLAIRNGRSPTKKRARPRPENWDPPIRQDVTTALAAPSTLIAPTA
jgi:RNA polymerase sigma-70 factor (ECF subfamily)